MLIYNYVKEFIGIDESYLKTFGFSDLAQLRAESADFADFFVKTPGHIHNFKHVHWIDFIDCADASEELKVIMSIKSKTYTAKLTLRTVYLTDSPSSRAFLIELNNLRALNAKEHENISDELLKKPTPQAAIDDGATSFKSQSSASIVKEEYTVESSDLETSVADLDVALDIDLDSDEDFAPLVKQEERYVEETFEDDKDDFVEVDLETLDIPTHTPVHTSPPPPKEKKIEEVSTPEEDDYDYSYTFDPHVASDELGLPVDLIEEFIEDFISQAKDFKDNLYKALAEVDIENVKILSHKLKGVAANLRVEDAFAVLTTVNTSEDINEIRANLNIFYKIIAKLSGEEISLPSKPEVKTVDESSFVSQSEPEINIKDSDVPEKIELVELADDDFYATDVKIDDYAVDVTEEVQIEPEEELVVDYHKEVVANSIGLDLETFNELLEDYILDSRIVSAKIHTALENEAFAICKKEALMLKSMSESMHMKSFNAEVECLINSSDKNEMTKAIETIDKVITQISNKA